MPKVQITETYKYSSSGSDLTNFTAYIPAKAKEDVVEPTLYTSYNQLAKANYYNEDTKTFDFNNPKLYDDQDLNYLMARKLLEKGLPILLEGVDFDKDTIIGSIYDFTSYADSTTQTPWATGKVKILSKVTSGANEYYKVKVIANSVDPEKYVGDIYYILSTNTELDTRYEIYGDANGEIDFDHSIYVTLNAVTYTDPIIDFERLQDKALYNIRFLTLGKYNTDKALIQSMINCAAVRKDAIALTDDLLDMSDITPASIYTNVSTQVGKVRTYFEDLIKVNGTDLSNDILKNAAGFTPWFKASLNAIQSGKEVKVEEKVPASFGYLSAFIKAVKQNPEWFAMAGSFRGNIDEFIKVDYDYSSAEVEILQGRSKLKDVELDNVADNVGLAINPISKIIPFGYLINGNRTLYVGDADETNRPNYRAILSIRNLVCALAKQLYYASKKYTFEPNTDITYINFKSTITPLLDKMRSGLGIRGYRFDRIPTTAKGRISAKISVKPIEPVEDFDLTIELDETVDIIED